MSDPIASTSLVEIRHLESGERVSDEQLTRYARHIIDQAGTSQHSNHVWQSPPMRRPPIGRFSSTRFAYSQPPPNKRSLIRTIPVAPPSNIPPLLDWGSSPTELENLGLSGLEEFRSAVKPSTIELPVVEQLLLKRRRSIEERPQVPGSSLTKKPRFAVAQPSPSNLASSVISTKVQNAALFALQSKSSTKGNGSVRLRLGLTKRTNIGSKLKPNRPLHTPHNLSVNVKLRPRLQAESDPSSFSTTEPSDSSSSVGGTFALRFKIPGSVLATSTNEKLQIQPPMKAMSGDSRTSNASKGSSSNVLDSGGRVLVPASPSLLTDRIMDVSKTRASDPKPSGSCVDTSMLLDSASEFSLDSSRNAISSLNPLPLLSAASPLQTNDHRAAPREGDSTNIESDILLSGSLSLPLEESGQSDSLARNDTCANLSSYLDTSYLLEPRQLMASVLCDSSHNSNDSQDDQLTRSLNPFAATSTTIDNYESPPWDLSQQDDQNVQSHDHDLRSPMSLTAAKRMEADSLHLDDSDMNEHSSGKIDSSDPKSRYAKLGLISVLYDPSQDSLRSQPRKGTPSDQRHQGDVNHYIDGDVSIPRPSWSSDTSLQSRSNYLLSGTRASNSWEYSPRLTGTPDDLVSASRSLSLEDFEVRRPSDHQSLNASPVRSTPPDSPAAIQ
ncbi:hypothetical protein OPQ81_003551 [Rhizoctonia solani]|nr:hypothetical protein OPQ81_003551 [Rhizoctonia solani]